MGLGKKKSLQKERAISRCAKNCQHGCYFVCVGRTFQSTGHTLEEAEMLGASSSDALGLGLANLIMQLLLPINPAFLLTRGVNNKRGRFWGGSRVLNCFFFRSTTHFKTLGAFRDRTYVKTESL